MNKELRNMPQFSIIVPIYNAEKTLRRCVDSILSQTVTDFELLLINDGSKDASGTIIDEYAANDNRIRTFHKTNGGVSSARNVGLDNARGEWLCFCDSDDYTYPCWLKNFEENISSGAELIVQGFTCNRDLHIPSLPLQESTFGFDFIGGGLQAEDLMREVEMRGFLWNKALRRDIVQREKIRFDEKVKFNEDGLVYFQYLECVLLVKSVSKVGYHYEAPANFDMKYDRRDFDTYVPYCLTAVKEKKGLLFNFTLTWVLDIFLLNVLTKDERASGLWGKMKEIIKEYNRQHAIVIKDRRFALLRMLARVPLLPTKAAVGLLALLFRLRGARS